MTRARARSALDRFESEQQSFFEAVRSSYLSRAELAPERYVIVDASADLDQVQQRLQPFIDQVLERWRG